MRSSFEGAVDLAGSWILGVNSEFSYWFWERIYDFHEILEVDPKS